MKINNNKSIKDEINGNNNNKNNNMNKNNNHKIMNNKSKPKKQSKSKSKKSKSKSKQNLNQTNDYLSLKKQYEGMVKLWNEERANLKKAQQLLRNQKDNFKLQQQSLENDHLIKIDEIKKEYQQEIKCKTKTIETLEQSLLKVKEERNIKIEDGDELKEKIKELEREKYEILKEKSSLSLEKQEQIESIRGEFELERAQWEKERKILTQNFERETFLEKENVENTNALARSNSTLQQKELENARLKGELRWLKQDKDDLTKTNQLLKEENISSQQQIDTLQQIISDKTKEMIQIKNKYNDELNEEKVKYNKIKIESEKLKQELNKNESDLLNVDNDRNNRQLQMEKRIKDLTNSLLEKQTELDMCISKKNEYRIKLSKLEDTISSSTIDGNNSKGHHLSPTKDLEMGLTKRGGILNRSKSGLTLLRRRNYTSYKSINYGISVFDRIGLEFAHVLRNRPWMRLLIVFYIIVLHLWCGIVLHFSMNHVEDDSH